MKLMKTNNYYYNNDKIAA